MGHENPRYSPPDLLRWLVFGGMLAILAVILLLLPQSAGIVLFGGMLVISLAFWFRLLILPALRAGALWSSGRWRARLVAWVGANRALASRLLASGACGCMILSAASFQPVSGARWPAYGQGVGGGLLLAVMGGVLLSGALRAGRPVGSFPAPTSGPLTPERSHWRVAALGVLALALLAEVNGQALGLGLLADMSPHGQFVLLVGGMILLIGGLGGLSWPGRRPAARRQEVWLLLGITAAALILRFWRLGETVRVLVDELNFILPTLSALDGHEVKLLQPFSGMIPFPSIYPYWQAGGVALIGRGLGGFRAASAVIGALTVPALYVLARALFDRRTALLAALMLLTFPPHYHFSRIGLNNIADPLFGTLALAFLAQGLRTNRRVYFALGGAALGLTQYFYDGGRWLFPALALFWSGLGSLWWRPRPSRRGLMVAGLAAVVVAVPIYYTLVGIQWPLTGRLGVSGLNAEYWQRLATGAGMQQQFERLAATLLIYVHQPENTVFYGGDTPLILPVLIPLFLLGITVVVRRWREPGPWLLLSWLVGTSLGNSLLVDSAAASRYVVIFPALTLFMAVGIRWAVPLLWPGRSARWHQLAMMALAAAVTITQAAYYFGPHLRLYNRQVRPNMDGVDAMIRSVDFPPGTRLFLVSDDVNVAYAGGALALMTDHLDVEGLSPRQVTASLLATLPGDVDYAFYVEPTDVSTPELLRERFPHLEPPARTPYADVPPERAFVLYYAPAARPAEPEASQPGQ